MAKIRTALSMLGSAKDAKKFADRFDDPSRSLPAESLFPPDEVRPASTDARTLLLAGDECVSGRRRHLRCGAHTGDA